MRLNLLDQKHTVGVGNRAVCHALERSVPSQATAPQGGELGWHFLGADRPWGMLLTLTGNWLSPTGTPISFKDHRRNHIKGQQPCVVPSTRLWGTLRQRWEGNVVSTPICRRRG